MVLSGETKAKGYMTLSVVADWSKVLIATYGVNLSYALFQMIQTKII